MLDHYRAHGDAQFEIRFVTGDDRYAQETFAILSKSLPVVTGYFLLSDPFPKVRVVLVPDRNEYDRLVRNLLRVEIEVPSNPARIAQPQRTDMVLLSPAAYEAHSIYKYIPGDFKRLLVHELVHMVEEYLSPNMEASPRWWGEGLAVYLSEQWHHEDEFRKAAIDGISGNSIPGFRQIEADRTLAYHWGWTIVQFIETVYGRNMILRIVRECADGNVFSIIGDSVERLEKQWRSWLVGEGRLKPGCIK